MKRIKKLVAGVCIASALGAAPARPVTDLQVWYIGTLLVIIAQLQWHTYGEAAGAGITTLDAPFGSIGGKGQFEGGGRLERPGACHLVFTGPIMIYLPSTKGGEVTLTVNARIDISSLFGTQMWTGTFEGSGHGSTWTGAVAAVATTPGCTPAELDFSALHVAEFVTPKT